VGGRVHTNEGGRKGRHTETHERTVKKLGYVPKKNGHWKVRLGPGRDCRFSVFVFEGRRGREGGRRRGGRMSLVSEAIDGPPRNVDSSLAHVPMSSTKPSALARPARPTRVVKERMAAAAAAWS